MQTVQSFAARLGVTETTVHNWINEGNLDAIAETGKCTLISEESAEEFTKKNPQYNYNGSNGYTIKQFAKTYGFNPYTVRSWVNNGTLAVQKTKVGGRMDIITVEEAKRFLMTKNMALEPSAEALLKYAPTAEVEAPAVPEPQPEPAVKYISHHDLAERAGLQFATILHYIETGIIPAEKMETAGGKPYWRIKESDAVAFLTGRINPETGKRKYHKSEIEDTLSPSGVYYSVSDAAVALDISEKAVRNLLMRRKLGRHQLGHHRIGIPREEIVRYVTESGEKSGHKPNEVIAIEPQPEKELESIVVPEPTPKDNTALKTSLQDLIAAFEMVVEGLKNVEKNL